MVIYLLDGNVANCMIEIFKSEGGKTIIAIYPDSQLSLSNSGEVGLIVGSKEGLSELRIALNMQFDGWTEEEIEASGFKKTIPLTPAQKESIMATYKDGHTASEVAKILKLNPQQVSGVIQGRLHPVIANIAAKAAKCGDPIDKIIANGRKAGHDFVHIANEINTTVGGHWLANDVANRLKEMQR